MCYRWNPLTMHTHTYIDKHTNIFTNVKCGWFVSFFSRDFDYFVNVNWSMTGQMIRLLKSPLRFPLKEPYFIKFDFLRAFMETWCHTHAYIRVTSYEDWQTFLRSINVIIIAPYAMPFKIIQTYFLC